MGERLAGEEVSCCEKERGEERDGSWADDVAEVTQETAVSGGGGRKATDWRSVTG